MESNLSKRVKDKVRGVVDLKKCRPGFISVCGRGTQEECFERMLFGSKRGYAERVLSVKKGDIGFLYNIDTHVLFGVFEAVSDGTIGIEPDAWGGSFPAQVRIDWIEKCEPIENARSLFRKLGIKFGSTLLTLAQTDNLRKAFERVSPLEEDFRKKYPAKYRALDGHYVRTKSEVIIDNWLYNKRIVHAYERKLPIEEDMYCDFFLPQGECYIEYWGMQDAEYSKRKRKKQELYRRYGLNLIELNEKDIQNIDDVLPKKLREFLPSTFKIA